MPNQITRIPNQTSSSSSSSSSTNQACAACKYQRRKCAPDCILAPYFPHDRQRQFLNAHKLFGVSNITKMIKDLDRPLKHQAMRTIIFQSDVRANDPAGGCYRIICDLQRQIEFSKAELDLVLHQLAMCRAQAQAKNTTDDYYYNQDHTTDNDDYVVVQDNNNNNNHVQEDVGAWAAALQDSSLSEEEVNKESFVKTGIVVAGDLVAKEDVNDFVEDRFVRSTQLIM